MPPKSGPRRSRGRRVNSTSARLSTVLADTFCSSRSTVPLPDVPSRIATCIAEATMNASARTLANPAMLHLALVRRTPGISCEAPIRSGFVSFIPLWAAPLLLDRIRTPQEVEHRIGDCCRLLQRRQMPRALDLDEPSTWKSPS